jgi:hypothetical protein
MKILLIPVIILTACQHANAQDTAPELITDRPDQTESSSVVPAKTLQIESGFVTGFNETDRFKNREYAYNGTLLRYGLLDNAEFRVGLEYLGEKTTGKPGDSLTTTHGFGPLYTGFKLQITREDGLLPEIAFLAGLGLPFTADRDFKPAHSYADMRFSVSHTLSRLFSLGYNLGVEWDGESAVPSYFYSAVLGTGISPRLGFFVEIFGLLPEAGNSSHTLDGGFTFLLTPLLQLDISGGLGLNETASDNFVSCGFSYRLPR